MCGHISSSKHRYTILQLYINQTRTRTRSLSMNYCMSVKLVDLIRSCLCKTRCPWGSLITVRIVSFRPHFSSWIPTLSLSSSIFCITSANLRKSKNLTYFFNAILIHVFFYSCQIYMSNINLQQESTENCLMLYAVRQILLGNIEFNAFNF